MILGRAVFLTVAFFAKDFLETVWLALVFLRWAADPSWGKNMKAATKPPTQSCISPRFNISPSRSKKTVISLHTQQLWTQFKQKTYARSTTCRLNLKNICMSDLNLGRQPGRICSATC